MAVELITDEKRNMCLEHVRRAIRKDDQRAAVDAINWLFGDSRELQTIRRIELALQRGDCNEAHIAVEALFRSEHETGKITDESSVRRLGLSDRIIEALEENEVYLIGHICKYNRVKLQRTSGLGAGSIKTIEEALEKIGRTLKPYV